MSTDQSIRNQNLISSVENAHSRFAVALTAVQTTRAIDLHNIIL